MNKKFADEDFFDFYLLKNNIASISSINNIEDIEAIFVVAYRRTKKQGKT